MASFSTHDKINMTAHILLEYVLFRKILCVCVCVRACVCVCMYVCMYVCYVCKYVAKRARVAFLLSGRIFEGGAASSFFFPKLEAVHAIFLMAC